MSYEIVDSSIDCILTDHGTPFKINWVHSVMKYAGQLPEDWELTQCLFGEHLLSAIRQPS